MPPTSRQGTIYGYAVKVGGDAGGSAAQVLAKALAQGLRATCGLTMVRDRPDLSPGEISVSQVKALASWLIDELGAGASAQEINPPALTRAPD